MTSPTKILDKIVPPVSDSPVRGISRTKLIAAAFLFVLVTALISLRGRYEAGATKTDAVAAGEQSTNSWLKNRDLLNASEREQSRLRMVVVKQRKLYQEGVISKSEVAESERLFVAVLTRIQDLRRSMAEAELAIAQVEVANGLPEETASTGGNPETALSHFHAADRGWSLQRAQDVENYFYRNFGHALPVSAFGQTATHTHMRFDHRDAMDVALYPDSREGKALIEYLRRSGIPYLTFRGAVAGAATGAHIHIGRPSRRMAAAG